MSAPKPLPALDLSQSEIFFRKEGTLNDLLKPRGGNELVSGVNFFEVVDKVSKLTELGSSPVLFLDSSGHIRLSVGHWKPDDYPNKYVATLDQDDLMEFSLLEGAGQQPPKFFLEGVLFEKFFKASDIDKSLGLVSITGQDKENSIPGISAVVLPPSLRSILSDLNEPIEPVAFLKKLCSTLKEREITVTDKGNLRKSISKHVKDLVTFGIVACSAGTDENSFAATPFLAPKDCEEITFEKVEDFLESVKDDITQDDDYYHGDEGANSPTGTTGDESPTHPRPSRPSISPSLLGSPRANRNSSTTEASAIVQLTNVISTFVTTAQESLANNNVSRKKSFFDKEARENLKEQLLYLQSWNGMEPAAVLDPETEKFYKLSATNQAADLGSDGLVTVSPAVCQSLQFSISTSKNLHEPPRGISIFGLKIQKDQKLSIALLSQGLSEHVVKASFPDEELKSLAVASIEVPTNVFHLMEILKGFKLFLTKYTGANSYILERYSDFVQQIEPLQQELYRCFEVDGPVFIYSFLQAINGKIATFVNLCKGKTMSVLSFDEIVANLRESRFMNSFRVEVPESLKPSTEVTKSEKKRSNPHSHSEGGKKKGKNQTNTVTSPYTDLLWSDWKTKANGKIRSRNGIDLPTARGRYLCPRFYFEGSCSFGDCLESKGHFTNLNSSEKALITGLKAKCIQCTSGSANMRAIDRLYKSHGMTSKYTIDEEEKAMDIAEDEIRDTKVELSETGCEPKDPDERVMKLIQDILDAPSPTFKESPFIFENTKKARVHNSKILEQFDFDFRLAMNSIDKSVIHPGSEFRDSELLEPLLKNHPDWKILKEIMDLGVDLGLDPSKSRDEETRLKDFDDALQKGNSGTMNDRLAKETVAKNQEKEISFGRTIPITIECARKLKNGSLIPLGCAVQWTINELNEKIVKRRTTHNLSYEWLSGLSVNSSVDPDCLEEIIYGHCLYRCIHTMHQMRLRYPKVAILMSKFDIDSAFRRLHSWCEHAPLYMSALPSPDCKDELTAFLDVRIPFGGNQGPGKFGIVSETATDIANYLMKNKAWNPEKLKSSFSEKIPDKALLDEMVEFGQAFPLLEEIQNHKTYWDVFVDDLINLTLNEMGLEDKAKEAAAIALELLFRPKVEGEEVDRNTILKWEKLLAEGQQEEVKVILGWLINSRIWRIFIPDDKAKRWMMDIDVLIEKGRNKERVYRQELESIIGKANEAAFIARELRFFLSRLRFRLKCAIKYGSAFLHTEDVQDLLLIRRYFEHLSTKGRSLNHVSVTLPSLFLKQDASSSVGMGGFNDLGFAWKIVLHPEILELFHINTLEHLAGVTNIWMAILLLHLNGDGNGMKFLDQSDNMTAIAWMIRSSYFNTADKADSRIREVISRKLADLMGSADIGIYLQHVPGIENIIADILSRHRNDSNSQIHSLLLQEAKDILENTGLELKIVDVPEVIICWIKSIVEELMQIKALPRRQKKRIRNILENGGVSQPVPDLTFSSLTRDQKEEFKSSVRSRSRSDIIDLAKKHSIDFEEIRLRFPSTMFARPSSRMDFHPLN